MCFKNLVLVVDWIKGTDDVMFVNAIKLSDFLENIRGICINNYISFDVLKSIKAEII